MQKRRRGRVSGSEIVTVAIRRVNLSDPSAPMLVDYVLEKYTFLPNTAGCLQRGCRAHFTLAREAGGWSLVKLEVLGDETLYPNMPETLRAAELLINDGFEVMVYCSDDPIMARELKILAVAPSCRSARPSGQGWAFKIPSTFA